jgi:hypothetical protein
VLRAAEESGMEVTHWPQALKTTLHPWSPNLWLSCCACYPWASLMCRSGSCQPPAGPVWDIWVRGGEKTRDRSCRQRVWGSLVVIRSHEEQDGPGCSHSPSAASPTRARTVGPSDCVSTVSSHWPSPRVEGTWSSVPAHNTQTHLPLSAGSPDLWVLVPRTQDTYKGGLAHCCNLKAPVICHPFCVAPRPPSPLL